MQGGAPQASRAIDGPLPVQNAVGSLTKRLGVKPVTASELFAAGDINTEEVHDPKKDGELEALEGTLDEHPVDSQTSSHHPHGLSTHPPPAEPAFKGESNLGRSPRLQHASNPEGKA